MLRGLRLHPKGDGSPWFDQGRNDHIDIFVVSLHVWNHFSFGVGSRMGVEQEWC